MTRGVYLIHFSEPYKHAKHYVGWSDNIEERVAQHIKGQGSRLCQVVVEAGITLLWVRSWDGADRKFERKLHNKGKSVFCPICNRHGWKHNKPAPEIELSGNADVDFYEKRKKKGSSS